MQTKDELVTVTSLEQMGQAVLQWHDNTLARLSHYTEIPTGSTLTIDGVEHVVEGDFLLGFISAMKIIYTELANNPAIVETSDEPPH